MRSVLRLLVALVVVGSHVVLSRLLATQGYLEKAAEVDAKLADLRRALLSSDGPSVLQITHGMRAPFEASSGQADHVGAVSASAASKSDHSNASSIGHASTSALAAPKANEGKCIFDDHLFSLTDGAKAELAVEMEGKEMQEAVAWVRHGGWWSCAREGKECSCTGEVRIVDIDRKDVAGAKLVDAKSLGGKVPCEGASFGVQRKMAAWPSADEVNCECRAKKQADASTTDGFHLEPRLTSKSRFQEAWVFMLRLLGRREQLPLGTGDKTFSGMENWGARSSPMGDTYPLVVFERFWLRKYMRETVAPEVKGSRCLEWGNPERPGTEFVYASLVAACTQPYDLQFDYIYWQGHGMGVTGNVVHSDILNLPQVLGPHLKMDVIFATQVFEHLAEPFPAAQALYEATAPGGLVVFTAPQMAQFHKVPHDYFRYTVEGAKYVLVKAGFCVPNSGFAGGGDFMFDVGRDAGLQIQDFSLEEIEAGYQVGYDNVSHGAIGIHALAFKPPHASCSDPTAGWAELGRQGIRA